MATLEELKRQCEKVKRTAIQLKKDMDRRILQRDIPLLVDKFREYQMRNPNVERVDSLDIQIVEYDCILCLEVNDKRGLLPYLWSFRLEYHHFKCRIYDHFLYQKRMHHVQMINDPEDVNLLDAIDAVIGEYEETIDALRRDTEPEQYTITYEFEDEKKACSCPSILQVYETISANVFYPKV